MKQLIPRKFERKRILGEAVLRPLPNGAPLPAQVLDLAQSGLAIFTGRSLAQGELVEVKFQVRPAAGGGGLDKRDGRVVRSRSLADGNVLGIEFTQPLNADELYQLESHWVRS